MPSLAASHNVCVTHIRDFHDTYCCLFASTFLLVLSLTHATTFPDKAHWSTVNVRSSARFAAVSLIHCSCLQDNWMKLPVSNEAMSSCNVAFRCIGGPTISCNCPMKRWPVSAEYLTHIPRILLPAVEYLSYRQVLDILVQQNFISCWKPVPSMNDNGSRF